jgi:hypothetical protein
VVPAFASRPFPGLLESFLGRLSRVAPPAHAPGERCLLRDRAKRESLPGAGSPARAPESSRPERG